MLLALSREEAMIQQVTPPISQPFLGGVSRLEHLSSLELECRRFWRSAECWRATPIRSGQAVESSFIDGGKEDSYD